MIKPGVKGKCLTCPYFKCESETAWCYGNKIRKIYTSRITDEERSSMNTIAEIKVLRAKKKAETLEKLLTKVNPSWCIFRKDWRKSVISCLNMSYGESQMRVLE